MATKKLGMMMALAGLAMVVLFQLLAVITANEGARVVFIGCSICGLVLMFAGLGIRNRAEGR
jgi:hypothetical protein